MNPKEKQATPQVAFVFLGSFMNEPPAIAGSRNVIARVRELIKKEKNIMTHKFPHLCSPITIAGRTFSNRMFSAMGGTNITNDGCIGPKSTAFMSFVPRAAQQL